MICDTTAESEAIFRSLVALGTALSIRKEGIKVAADKVFRINEALESVKRALGKENRIKEVIAETEALLQ